MKDTTILGIFIGRNDDNHVFYPNFIFHSIRATTITTPLFAHLSNHLQKCVTIDPLSFLVMAGIYSGW